MTEMIGKGEGKMKDKVSCRDGWRDGVGEVFT